MYTEDMSPKASSQQSYSKCSIELSLASLGGDSENTFKIVPQDATKDHFSQFDNEENSICEDSDSDADTERWSDESDESDDEEQVCSANLIVFAGKTDSKYIPCEGPRAEDQFYNKKPRTSLPIGSAAFKICQVSRSLPLV